MIRIFDKDDDGFITVEDLRRIMTKIGEGINKNEVKDMIREADSDNDGLVNYKGIRGGISIRYKCPK